MSRYRRERVAIETARGGLATRRLLLWLTDRLEDASRAPSITVGDAPSQAAEGSLHLGDRLKRRVSGAWRAMLEPDADGDLVLPEGRVRASALQVPDGEGGWEDVGGGGGAVPEVRTNAFQTISENNTVLTWGTSALSGDGVSYDAGVFTLERGVWRIDVELIAIIPGNETGGLFIEAGEWNTSGISIRGAPYAAIYANNGEEGATLVSGSYTVIAEVTGETGTTNTKASPYQRASTGLEGAITIQRLADLP